MKLKELMREVVSEEKEKRLSVRQRICRFAKLYMCFLVMTAVFQFVYIEIGHDKGWPYAERWYNCIHK